MKKIEGMPLGSVVQICGATVPDGWIATAVQNPYCATLGAANYIGRTIERIDTTACIMLMSVSISSGNWNNPAIWAGGLVPPPDAMVYINHAITVTSNSYCKGVEIAPTGNIILANGSNLIVDQ